MTVEATTPTVRYVYTGPGDYTFSFRIFEATDIAVYHTAENGLVTPLVNGEDFTVSVDGQVGGTAAMVYDQDSGYIDIRLDLPITQTSDLESQGPLDMESLEVSLDRVVMILQQMDAIINEGAAFSNWRGTWITDTAYTARDVVVPDNGSWYYCTVAHTSASEFATDLASGKWMLVFDVSYLEQLTSESAQSAAEASASSEAAAEAEATVVPLAAVVVSSAEQVAEDLIASEAAALRAENAAAEAEGIADIASREDIVWQDNYTATAGQTSFVVTHPAPKENIIVFLNSRKMRVDEDYTLNSDLAASLVILDAAASLGDEVDILSFNILTPWAVGVAYPEKYATGTEAADGWHEAINLAFAASKHVYLGGTDYLVKDQLIMQTNQLIQGGGKYGTSITKGFDGDLFSEFKTGSGFIDIALLGDGESFTGRCLPVLGTSGQQYMHRFRIIDFDGYCLEFATDAGSQSIFSDGTIARYDGLTAGRYSIKIEDVEQLEAVPRKFANVETDGTLCADLGGGGGAQFSGGFNGGFLFSDNTRAVHITDMRIGNIDEMTVKGHNNFIKGCGINPDIIVASGADNNVIIGNSYNGTVTDSSGNGRNIIEYPSVEYTPVWTGATTNPVIGNGTLTGEQTRSGDKITVSIELVVGSTTTFGSGAWRFSLPKTPQPTAGAAQSFPVLLTDSGTTQVIGMAVVVNNQGYFDIAIPGGLTLVDATHPWTWAAGDIIRATFTYIV